MILHSELKVRALRASATAGLFPSPQNYDVQPGSKPRAGESRSARPASAITLVIPHYSPKDPEYDASGLTQEAFARRAGINFHTLVAWLGRRRREGTAPEVRFREVCLRGSAEMNVAPLEVTLPGGVIVRGGNATAVAELVRALRA